MMTPDDSRDDDLTVPDDETLFPQQPLEHQSLRQFQFDAPATSEVKHDAPTSFDDHPEVRPVSPPVKGAGTHQFDESGARPSQSTKPATGKPAVRDKRPWNMGMLALLVALIAVGLSAYSIVIRPTQNVDASKLAANSGNDQVPADQPSNNDTTPSQGSPSPAPGTQTQPGGNAVSGQTTSPTGSGAAVNPMGAVQTNPPAVVDPRTVDNRGAAGQVTPDEAEVVPPKSRQAARDIFNGLKDLSSSDLDNKESELNQLQILVQYGGALPSERTEVANWARTHFSEVQTPAVKELLLLIMTSDDQTSHLPPLMDSVAINTWDENSAGRRHASTSTSVLNQGGQVLLLFWRSPFAALLSSAQLGAGAAIANLPVRPTDLDDGKHPEKDAQQIDRDRRIWDARAKQFYLTKADQEKIATFPLSDANFLRGKTTTALALAKLCLEYGDFTRGLKEFCQPVIDETEKLLLDKRLTQQEYADLWLNYKRLLDLRQQLSIGPVKSELVGLQASFTNLKDAVTINTPNRLKDELTKLEQTIRLASLLPESLIANATQLQTADYAQRKILYDEVAAAYAALQARGNDPMAPPFSDSDSMDVSNQVRELREKMSQLQVRNLQAKLGEIPSTVSVASIDRSSADDFLAQAQQQLDSLRQSFSQPATDDAALAAIGRAEAGIKQLLAQDKRQLSPQDSANLDDSLRGLIDGIVRLELRASARDVLPMPMSVETTRAFVSGLNLPARLITLRPTQPGAEQLSLWNQLNEDVNQVLAKLAGVGPLSAVEATDLHARVHRILYGLLTLETRNQLAKVPQQVTGSSSPHGGVTQADLTDAINRVRCELAAQTKLGKVLDSLASDVAQQLQQARDQSRLLEGTIVEAKQSNANELQSLRQQIRQEIDVALLQPRAMPSDQLSDLSDDTVARILKILAAYGYAPPDSTSRGAEPNNSQAGSATGSEQIDPALPAPDPNLARALYAWGWAAFFSNESDGKQRAAEYFADAARYNPTNPVYRYYLGLALYRQGRLAEAAAQVQAGKQLELKSTSFHVDGSLERVQGADRAWLEKLRSRI
jgi:hypothetical protein